MPTVGRDQPTANKTTCSHTQVVATEHTCHSNERMRVGQYSENKVVAFGIAAPSPIPVKTVKRQDYPSWLHKQMPR